MPEMSRYRTSWYIPGIPAVTPKNLFLVSDPKDQLDRHAAEDGSSLLKKVTPPKRHHTVSAGHEDLSLLALFAPALV
jgi:hypothetical protein